MKLGRNEKKLETPAVGEKGSFLSPSSFCNEQLHADKSSKRIGSKVKNEVPASHETFTGLTTKVISTKSNSSDTKVDSEKQTTTPEATQVQISN